MSSRQLELQNLKMNATELRDRLKRHYIKPGQDLPGGTFLPEVQSPAARRRCDAVYVGFTRSRGMYIGGHEIKVSRSDWLHELDQVDKAEWWFRHTDMWWLVVPDLTIAKPEELPPGWGMMTVNPRTKIRLDIVVQAEVREAEVDFTLLLELLKKEDTLRAEDRKTELKYRRESIRNGIAKALAEQEERPEREALQTLNRLQDITGIHFTGGNWKGKDGKELPWVSLERAGEALKTFCLPHAERLRKLDELEGRAKRAKADLRHIADEVTRYLGKLEICDEEHVGS